MHVRYFMLRGACPRRRFANATEGQQSRNTRVHLRDKTTTDVQQSRNRSVQKATLLLTKQQPRFRQGLAGQDVATRVPAEKMNESPRNSTVGQAPASQIW